MATGDVWRLSFEGLIQAQQMINTWHIRMKSGSGTPLGAVAYLNTNFYQLIKTNLSNAWSISVVHGFQYVDPANLYEQLLSIPAGSLSSESLPPQDAAVATLRTGIAGRSRRGRHYWAGLTESSQNHGAIDSAWVAAVQTYYDDLVAALGSGGSNADYEWGVWSKKLGEPSPHVYNLTSGFRPITEVVVRDIVRSQRRRQLGAGR